MKNRMKTRMKHGIKHRTVYRIMDRMTGVDWTVKIFLLGVILISPACDRDRKASRLGLFSGYGVFECLRDLFPQ